MYLSTERNVRERNAPNRKGHYTTRRRSYGIHNGPWRGVTVWKNTELETGGPGPSHVVFFHNPLTPSKRTRFYSRYQQRPRTSDIRTRQSYDGSRFDRYAISHRRLPYDLCEHKFRYFRFVTVPGGSGRFRKCLQVGGTHYLYSQ